MGKDVVIEVAPEVAGMMIPGAGKVDDAVEAGAKVGKPGGLRRCWRWIKGCFVGEKAAAKKAPEIGRKLDYLLGNATGTKHNIERSTEMLNSLKRIGLNDDEATRKLLTEHLTEVLNDAKNIARTQEDGTVVRESLLMGPLGGVKLQTVWEDCKLITANIFGG